MATYSFGASAIYLSDGSFATQLIAPSTLTDEEDTGVGSTTFEVGDTLTYPTGFSGAGDVTFLGTASFGGNTYFYAEFSGGDIQIFGTVFPSGGFFPPNLSDFTLFPGVAFPACFLAGTAISTQTGPVAVEALMRGDVVLTSDRRCVPVKWIGRQTVSTRFGPAERLMPVRIRAGALGGGLPTRDLSLTADHALLIDGLLVNAGALVNGGSIDFVPLSELGESFTVYHVETEAHDVILAECAPAETFIDYAARRAFDNYAEYPELYGEDRVITELPYPRVSAARMLPNALRDRLAKGEIAA